MNERDLFIAALQIDGNARRNAYLDEACSDDRQLRDRVTALLNAFGAAGSYLQHPVADANLTIDQPVIEQPGDMIGPYKLLQQIGEGGMGVVYMAEQTLPVHRMVALKLIRTGFDNRQVIARFEAERQALALMDHPNIARVLDAGATDNGRPYFVMELVKGVPIIDYCDQQQLSIRERVEVVIDVCRGIEHAHQKGIIHRDLKPSNVLVAEYGGRPVAKIIDFGVAKAIGQRLTERTMFTNFGQIVGTFEYMSPEQARLNQLDIDTRSDVYSLGVLLYELIAGSTPFDKQRCQQAAFDEILRFIREEEPPTPSTRLSASGALPAIAARRQTDPAKLRSLVRGELDWIVMKALDKDRGRRYQTAGALGHELQRYLLDEPVDACPPSASYRLAKFARRNRSLLLTVSLVATSLLVGLAVSISQAVRATNAERLAEARLSMETEAHRDAERARAMAESSAVDARQAVDEMYTEVAEKWLVHEPQMELVQREFLQKACKFYEELARQSPGADAGVRLETALASRRVAEIQHRLGQPDQAEDAFRHAADRLQALVDEFPAVPLYRTELATTLHRFGVLLGDTGRYHDEEQLQLRALALDQHLAAEEPANRSYRRALGRAHWHLAQVLLSLRRRPEAVPEYRAALAIQDALVSEVPANAEYREQLAESQLGLGQTLRLLGEYEPSQQALHAAAVLLEQLSAEYPHRPGYRNHLANVYFWRSRGPGRSLPEVPADAEQDLRKAITLQRRLVEDFPAIPDYRFDLCRSVKTLGWLLRSTNRPAEAGVAFHEAIAIAERLANDHPTVHYYRARLAESYQTLGQFLAEQGQLSQAEDAYRRSVDCSERLIVELPDVPAHRRLLRETCFHFASLLRTSGRPDEEAIVYRKALAVDWNDPEELSNLSWQLLSFPDAALRDADRAVELAGHAVELAPDVANHWRVLGVARYYTGDWDESIRAFSRANETQPDGFDYFVAAMAHWRMGREEEARRRYTNDAKWMDANNPGRSDLRRFRSEAAELLAISEPQPGDSEPADTDLPTTDNSNHATPMTANH